MLLEIGEILGLMFPRPGVTPPSPMLSDMHSPFPMDLCHALAATCTGKVHAARILEHEARADRRMEHAAIRRRGTRLTSWSMKRSKRERARQTGGARDKRQVAARVRPSVRWHVTADRGRPQGFG